MRPPELLDGAKVFCWAWSGDQPFGYVGDGQDPQCYLIYGLAICRYQKDSTFYRFSCDKEWEVIQDAAGYETIEEAIDALPDQYKLVSAAWRTD